MVERWKGGVSTSSQSSSGGKVTMSLLRRKVRDFASCARKSGRSCEAVGCLSFSFLATSGHPFACGSIFLARTVICASVSSKTSR